MKRLIAIVCLAIAISTLFSTVVELGSVAPDFGQGITSMVISLFALILYAMLTILHIVEKATNHLLRQNTEALEALRQELMQEKSA